MKKMEHFTLANNGYDIEDVDNLFDIEKEVGLKHDNRCVCVYCGDIIEKSKAKDIERTFKNEVSSGFGANIFGGYYETIIKRYTYDVYACNHCYKMDHSSNHPLVQSVSIALNPNTCNLCIEYNNNFHRR